MADARLFEFPRMFIRKFRNCFGEIDDTVGKPLIEINDEATNYN